MEKVNTGSISVPAGKERDNPKVVDNSPQLNFRNSILRRSSPLRQVLPGEPVLLRGFWCCPGVTIRWNGVVLIIRPSGALVLYCQKWIGGTGMCRSRDQENAAPNAMRRAPSPRRMFKDATVVSIAHRLDLEHFHDRKIILQGTRSGWDSVASQRSARFPIKSATK